MNRISVLCANYSTDVSIVAQKHPLTDDDTGVLSFQCSDDSWKHLVMSSDPRQFDIAYEVMVRMSGNTFTEVSCTCEDFKYRKHACKHCCKIAVRMLLLNDDLNLIRRKRTSNASFDDMREADIYEARMTVWTRGETVKGTVAA